MPRWTSFVADPPRGLHEAANPAHRLRVEHNESTLLIHLSDEGFTAGCSVSFAVDMAAVSATIRPSRETATPHT
jgi:hypothetical protein